MSKCLQFIKLSSINPDYQNCWNISPYLLLHQCFLGETGPFVRNQLKEGSRVFQQNLTGVSSWYISKYIFLMTSKRIWCHTKASYWLLSLYSSPHSPLIPDTTMRPSILIISGNQKANFKVSSQGQTSVYSNPLNFLGRFSTAIPVLTKQKRTKRLAS